MTFGGQIRPFKAFAGRLRVFASYFQLVCGLFLGILKGPFTGHLEVIYMLFAGTLCVIYLWYFTVLNDTYWYFVVLYCTLHYFMVIVWVMVMGSLGSS